MGESYDLAIVLNYYRPYVSGLTETAAVVAEGLAARGYRVAAVAAQHEAGVVKREVLNGVDVYRAPVVARIRKGVVSPAFPLLARRIIRSSAVSNLHLPMLEAGPIVRLTRGVPTIVTYQCDVQLTPAALNHAIVRAVDWSTRAAFRGAESIVVSSLDYVAASRVASAVPEGRVEEVAPPSVRREAGEHSFRETKGPHIGFLGRIVEEKGLDYLVHAFRKIADPDARLLIAGDFERVAGGSVIDHVRGEARGDDRVRFLGFLPNDRLSDFYSSLDAFVLPSVNSLEAFGIVQVEAMLAGVPVIASDLPGVRTPLRATGFGRVVPPRDADALARALEEVLALPNSEWRPALTRARATYGVEQTLDGYEAIVRRLGGSRLSRH